MAGVIGKVLFTRWTSAGFGRELNWHGRLLNRALARSTTGLSRAGEVDAVGASDLAERIGVVFKRIETPKGFTYQGRPAQIETFEAAETPFTIGQMKQLLELKGDEVRAIFRDRDWSVDKVIKESLDRAAGDVPVAERDNCPLVYVSKYEAEAVARLLASDLTTEYQWERAASGTDGKRRPWGNDLDQSRAVYSDSGTRPVKSRPAGASAEGLYDLIGNVWEWTKESVLRGGSWYYYDPDYLQADSRYSDYHPENRAYYVGFRLARTSKG